MKELEELTSEIQKLTEKVEAQQKKSTMDWVLTILEKALLPLALVWIGYKGHQLSKEVQKTQNELLAENIRLRNEEVVNSEEQAQSDLDAVYIKLIYEDLKKPGQRQDAIELITLVNGELAIVLNNYIAGLNDVTPEQKKSAGEITRDILIDEQIKTDDAVASLSKTIQDNPGSAEAVDAQMKVDQIVVKQAREDSGRVHTFDKVKVLVNQLSSSQSAEELEASKTAFWKYYYGDMVKYENKEVENAMIDFGNQLKSDDQDFVKLRELADGVKDAMNDQVKESTWVKEGYYRIRDNFRIVLIDLDNKRRQATFQIKDHRTAKASEETQNLDPISVNEPVEFTFDGTNYRLILSKIDRAGRNPFTKAAYYTIEEIN